MVIDHMFMPFEFPQHVPKKARSSNLSPNKCENVAGRMPLCSTFFYKWQVCIGPTLKPLGQLDSEYFWLGEVHPSCGSVPAGFLTFWKRVLTLSYYAS